ncbi:MAG TPA: MFS transporter [Gammaproteobacteria bacterium]|nr:MFS transporter [Gammaproteobacteria bacterium]
MGVSAEPDYDLARFLRTRRLIFTLLALAFMLGYFYRTAPGVMTDSLMSAFGTGGAALGTLVAIYFYVYTAMQLPAGVLSDRLGPRLSAFSGALLAGLGAVAFGLAPAFAVAGVGRLLMGLGTSTIFVGLMKANTVWFPEHRYGAVSGLAILLGIAGAFISAGPLALLMSWFTWRSIFVFAGVLALLLAVLILIFVRNAPEDAGFPSVREMVGEASYAASDRHWLADIARVLRDHQAWAIFWASFGTGGAFFGFAGLWGVPLLRDVFGLDRSHAAVYTSVSLIFLAGGALLMGWVSDKVRRRKPFIVGAAAVSASTWCAMLLLPWGPGGSALLLYSALGLAASAMTVGYAGAKEAADPSVSGMSIALVNTGLFLGVAVNQTVFGWLLDLGWNGHIENGVRHYDFAAYQHGLGFCLGMTVLALAAASRVRETHARQSAP